MRIDPYTIFLELSVVTFLGFLLARYFHNAATKERFALEQEVRAGLYRYATESAKNTKYYALFGWRYFAVGLFPDKRGYLRFEFLRFVEKDTYKPLEPTDNFEIEHASDIGVLMGLVQVFLADKAEEVKTDEGNHLYWKLKETNEQST